MNLFLAFLLENFDEGNLKEKLIKLEKEEETASVESVEGDRKGLGKRFKEYIY